MVRLMEDSALLVTCDEEICGLGLGKDEYREGFCGKKSERYASSG